MSADASAPLSARVVAGVFGAYKRFVSPVLPPACRFTPTCSEYAREAVTRHGVGRGLSLAVRRLARCHPALTGHHCRRRFGPTTASGDSQ